MAFDPTQHTVTAKALGVSGDAPTDGRCMFYDAVNFKYRAFVSTAEVLSYLTASAQRQPNNLIVVNTGGSLSAGVITGGTNALWHFKDGKTNGELVELSTGGGEGSSPVEQTLTDGATITWDYSLGSFAKVTLGGNRTLSLTNADAPCSGVLQVTQDGTGSRTLTLPGNEPTIFSLSTGAGEIDILGFVKTSTGIFWSVENYGTVSLDTTPPTVSSREALDDETIEVVFSESTQGTFAGWSAKVNGGSAIAATAISASGGTRQLTFPAASFANGDTITLSYSSGPGDTTDLALSPNDLASFTDAAVTNSIGGGAANTFSGMPAMSWIAAFDADNGLTNMVTSGGIPDLVVYPTGAQSLPTTDTNVIGGKNAWNCDSAHSFQVDTTAATIGDYYMMAIVFEVDAYASGGTGFCTILSSSDGSHDNVVLLQAASGFTGDLMECPNACYNTDPALPAAQPTVMVLYGDHDAGIPTDKMTLLRDGVKYMGFATAAQCLFPNIDFALGNYIGTAGFSGDKHIAAFYIGTSNTPYTDANADAVEAHLKSYYSIA